MKRESLRRVEALLRSGASDARREPSPALHARLTAALESGPTRTDPTSIVDPVGRSTRRERWQDVSVAASVAIAVALWVFAFSGLFRYGAGFASRGVSTARSTVQARWMDGFFALRDPGSPGVLAQLSRGSPQSLLATLDDPLLAELDHMAQDATQAARFLVGRLPASLVGRGTQGTSR